MYSNVRVAELIKIIGITYKNYLNTVIRSEIIKICKILTNHNYIQHKDLHYIQEDGLVMGAPT